MHASGASGLTNLPEIQDQISIWRGGGAWAGEAGSKGQIWRDERNRENINSTVQRNLRRIASSC